MKLYTGIALVIALMVMPISCTRKKENPDVKVIFLHHSTGGVIWRGDANSLFHKIARRISKHAPSGELPALVREHNRKQGTNYLIQERIFPKDEPYGWHNYPYDYYNIWVKHAGNEPYMEEPTLEILSRDYQVIIFKHCFPSSNILEDADSADIDSDIKTLGNYRLQYEALKKKLHSFPDTKFMLFTGAVHVESQISEDQALRAKEFNRWVIEEWDEPGDNIHLWDLYALQTEGGLYFRDAYAESPTNSHPNSEFAGRVVKLLSGRIIDVIENNGKGTDLTGLPAGN